MTSPRSGSDHQHVVLVVGDSQDTREALAAVLELNGYRAVAAGSGNEALHLMLALGLRPCVVVVDIVMPNLDGLTLRMAMQAHPEGARIPTVGLGGDARLRRQALDLGFGAALPKPCDVEDLLSLIIQVCSETVARGRAKPA